MTDDETVWENAQRVRSPSPPVSFRRRRPCRPSYITKFRSSMQPMPSGDVKLAKNSQFTLTYEHEMYNALLEVVLAVLRNGEANRYGVHAQGHNWKNGMDRRFHDLMNTRASEDKKIDFTEWEKHNVIFFRGYVKLFDSNVFLSGIVGDLSEKM